MMDSASVNMKSRRQIMPPALAAVVFLFPGQDVE